MKVLIRADSSINIGTGHVARCLTLASRLEKSGAFVAFACRDLPGASHEAIKAAGFELFVLPGRQHPVAAAVDRERPAAPQVEDWKADATAINDLARSWSAGRVDMIVVDHYGFDARWEAQVRASADRIMVIDDLADRPHDCDLLLDQNFLADYAGRYKGLVPDQCRLYLGPQYSLIRPEFYPLREAIRPKSGRIDKILISFGGADPSNQTGKAVNASLQIDPILRRNLTVDVLIGGSNPHRNSLEHLCRRIPWIRHHVATQRVAVMMAGADLAIGAGGITVWERCSLGLPAVVLTLAANQEAIVAAVAERGCIVSLGKAERVTTDDIARALDRLIRDPGTLTRMSRLSFDLLGAGPDKKVQALTDAILA